MKLLKHVWSIAFLSFALSGCGIGGHWMTGVSGQAREDYLKSIKPLLQYYEKPGWTVEGRRADSAECGAGNTDYVGFNNPARIKAAQRPGETDRQTESRLSQDWHACMEDKGYRYVRVPPPLTSEVEIDFHVYQYRSRNRRSASPWHKAESKGA